VQTCIWPSWCHCHSLSLASVKSRLVLPFWYRLTRVVPEKGPLNGCVCMCVALTKPQPCCKNSPWIRNSKFSIKVSQATSKNAVTTDSVTQSNRGTEFPQMSQQYPSLITHVHTHTHTHTRLTALFPGLPGWGGTRKVKPIWILLKQETVSGSGISWAICKSAPCSRQITMPAPHHSVFYRLGALLANSYKF